MNNAEVNIGIHLSLQINVFNFFSGSYSEEGLLGHMAALFLIVRGTAILFSIVAAPVHMPSSSVQGFFFSTSSPNSLFLALLAIAILTVVKCYLIMVLTCISLIAGEAEHLFIYLLAICMSSWEKCLFLSLIHISEPTRPKYASRMPSSA